MVTRSTSDPPKISYTSSAAKKKKSVPDVPLWVLQISILLSRFFKAPAHRLMSTFSFKATQRCANYNMKTQNPHNEDLKVTSYSCEVLGTERECVVMQGSSNTPGLEKHPARPGLLSRTAPLLTRPAPSQSFSHSFKGKSNILWSH